MKRVETNESAVKCLDWWKKARQTEARTSEVRGEYNCGRSLTPKLSLLSVLILPDSSACTTATISLIPLRLEGDLLASPGSWFESVNRIKGQQMVE